MPSQFYKKGGHKRPFKGRKAQKRHEREMALQGLCNTADGTYTTHRMVAHTSDKLHDHVHSGYNFRS